MTAARMAQGALEGKREWFDVVREKVESALSSSAECQELALRLASGVEDFKATEEGLRTAVLAGACAALARLLSEADDGRESAVCGECGEAMRRRSRRSVSLLTLFGLATVSRWHWTCVVCGARRCPLDAGLCVETGGERLTPALRSVVGWAAACASFGGAAEALRRVAGVAVCAKRVERSAKALGEELSKREAAEGDAAKADAPAETVYCCLDGTGVPVLPSERRGAGRGGEGEPAKTREAKVATFHTARKRDGKTGLPLRDAGSVRVSAAIESAASRDADPEPSPFGGRTWRAAKLFGFAKAKRRVAVGDGAKWIWNTVAEMLPGCVEIVDLWHAKEHLWEVGRAVHGHGTERCAQWSRRVCAALEAGRVEDVLAALRQHAETCEAAEKCVKYVVGNRHRMRYPKFRKMGLCVGSGVVESMCKGLVGERFKHRGMRWSVAGANAVLALRAAVFNDRYDDFWRPPDKAHPLAA